MLNIEVFGPVLIERLHEGRLLGWWLDRRNQRLLHHGVFLLFDGVRVFVFSRTLRQVHPPRREVLLILLLHVCFDVASGSNIAALDLD